ncbi:MAG: DUF4404 family protein [Gammaproteobacteria bacterium]|nr:DUF4404 family protein [Gammaproteobacteria bacterium]NND58918.1 DUF4404 family protein [Gammaproteobacteria bacterium]
MSDKDLTRLLQAAHDELEDHESVSPEQKRLMRDLMHDIQRTLGDDDDEDLGVGDRLNEAVDDFQQSHPTVAFALRRVMDALARMGI